MGRKAKKSVNKPAAEPKIHAHGDAVAAPDPDTAETAVTAAPRFSRRTLLACGAAGVACAAGAGGLGWFFSTRARAATLAEVFKNDAPKGDLWKQWQARDWAREASHYLTLGTNLQCKLCPNECILGPEDRGRCRNRVHKDGKLYTLAYGNPSLPQYDPIEKKPLFHFLPGTSAFSFSVGGCGFRCLNCQNWFESQRKPEELKDSRGAEFRPEPRGLYELDEDQRNRMTILPVDMPEMAECYYCRSIAYTYSEPTVWFEYMLDTAKAVRAKGLKNVMVTCGYIQQEPLKELCPYMDGAHVDLKGFTEESYQTLNSGKLAPVLETLKTLKREGVWFEVINLIVPTYTDKEDMVRSMCQWLVENLGPDCPLHFSRFKPEHKLTQLQPTPKDTLLTARSIAREAGLNYVYIGNCADIDDAGTTLCPHCKKAIVVRQGYQVSSIDIANGKCSFCKTEIPGVWA